MERDERPIMPVVLVKPLANTVSLFVREWIRRRCFDLRPPALPRQILKWTPLDRFIDLRIAEHRSKRARDDILDGL